MLKIWTIQKLKEQAPDCLKELVDMDVIDSKESLLSKCDVAIILYKDLLGPKRHLRRTDRKRWEREVEEIQSYMNNLIKLRVK